MIRNKVFLITGIILVGTVFCFFPEIVWAVATTSRVVASADDIFIWQSGSYFRSTTTAFDLGLVSSYKNEAAARFTNINIPRGSTINSAYLSITARLSRTATTVNSYLGAEATNSASRIISYADYWARPLTATTAWNNIGPWTASTTYDSPDISTAIREVINRPGWTSGNAINIFWKDNGSTNNTVRTGASWDNTTYPEPSLTIDYTPDTAPPVRSNASPTAGFIFPAGTTEVTIGLDTNENATCRYSDISGTPYSSMTNFSTTGGISHSALITGLTDGSNKNYYVRCQDIAGNAYEDDNFAISFSVASIVVPVFGFGWSENIGWIKFNSCTDPDNPVTCGPINYGVSIGQTTGNFSGYAWSENIGWIDFAPAGTYPDVPNYSSRLDLGTYKVSGWARALSYGDGWDGWIKLQGSNYEVSLNLTTKEFEGWAWGSDVIGWISFNRINCDPDKDGFSNGIGSCPPAIPPTPIPDYKVMADISAPPYIEAGSQEIEYQSYCGIAPGTGQVGFRWSYRDYDGDTELRFDFKVNNVNNVNDPNPEVDRSFSGLSNPDGSVNTQSVSVAQSPQPDGILYNTTYYWWARVWDSNNTDSGWVAGPFFTTVSRAYPWPDFTFTPPNPSQGEVVTFDPDTSQTFGGTTIASYLWTITEGAGQFATGTNETSRYPQIVFASSTNKVKLRITDSGPGSYSCESSPKTMGAQLPLPKYKEVPPVIWLRNFLLTFFRF